MSNKVLIEEEPDLEGTRNVSREGEIITEQHLALMSIGFGSRSEKHTRFEIAALNKTKRVSVFNRLSKLNLVHL